MPYDARFAFKVLLFTLTHTWYAVDTYTAQATVGDVNKGLTNHKVGFPYTLSVILLILPLTQNLESSDTALLVFGNGDGGGGPLAKMLENVRLSLPSPYQSD